MECEYCGRALKPGEWQCPGCGAPINQNKEKADSQKEESTQKTAQANSNKANMNGPNYNRYYEQYGSVDRGRPLHISAYGGFFRRGIAQMIDFCIIGFIYEMIFPHTHAMIWLIYVAYHALGDSRIFNGATLGKKIMGLKVVDENFEILEVSQSVKRAVSKIISWWIILLGFIVIIFSKRKQGFHDRIARTLVIRTRI